MMPIHCDIKTVNAVNAIKDKYFFIPKAVQQPAAMKIAPSILPVTFRQCSFSSFFNSWLMFSTGESFHIQMELTKIIPQATNSSNGYLLLICKIEVVN